MPHCVKLLEQLPAHVTWFVEAQPPAQEQLLDKLVGCRPAGHVVPQIVEVEQEQPRHCAGQAQDAEQVVCWHVRQPVVLVLPGVQTPSPPQAPYAPHAQLALQLRDCVPHMPQACELVAPGAQTPAPVQTPHEPHAQLPEHVRVCVPHIVPHARDSIAPGAQTPSPPHAP